MSAADYVKCIICNGKAIYDGDDNCPADVFAMHAECYQKMMKQLLAVNMNIELELKWAKEES